MKGDYSPKTTAGTNIHQQSGPRSGPVRSVVLVRSVHSLVLRRRDAQYLLPDQPCKGAMGDVPYLDTGFELIGLPDSFILCSRGRGADCWRARQMSLFRSSAFPERSCVGLFCGHLNVRQHWDGLRGHRRCLLRLEEHISLAYLRNHWYSYYQCAQVCMPSYFLELVSCLAAEAYIERPRLNI